MNAKKQARRAAALARLTIMDRETYVLQRCAAGSSAKFDRWDRTMFLRYTRNDYLEAHRDYVARKMQERAALGG